jgi:hypothetical protein
MCVRVCLLCPGPPTQHPPPFISASVRHRKEQNSQTEFLEARSISEDCLDLEWHFEPLNLLTPSVGNWNCCDVNWKRQRHVTQTENWTWPASFSCPAHYRTCSLFIFIPQHYRNVSIRHKPSSRKEIKVWSTVTAEMVLSSTVSSWLCTHTASYGKYTMDKVARTKRWPLIATQFRG